MSDPVFIPDTLPRTQIKRLRAAEYNPRTITVEEREKLKSSLREFGFVQPLVANSDGTLVGGHQRLEAYIAILTDEGLTPAQIGKREVPTIMVELTEERAKLLNLALNKIGGDWDYDKLAALFGTLKDIDPAEVALSGFDNAEIEDLLATVASDVPAADSEPQDVDAALAVRGRRLVFDIETEADAEMARRVLRKFGMGGPRSAAPALLKALEAAETLAPPSADETTE